MSQTACQTCPRPTGSVNVLTGDVHEQAVDRHNAGSIKANKGHTVNPANFRDDLNLSGVVDKPDKQAVWANQGYSIP